MKYTNHMLLIVMGLIIIIVLYLLVFEYPRDEPEPEIPYKDFDTFMGAYNRCKELCNLYSGTMDRYLVRARGSTYNLYYCTCLTENKGFWLVADLRALDTFPSEVFMYREKDGEQWLDPKWESLWPPKR